MGTTFVGVRRGAESPPYLEPGRRFPRMARMARMDTDSIETPRVHSSDTEVTE
jgi:hypothetical protein